VVLVSGDATARVSDPAHHSLRLQVQRGLTLAGWLALALGGVAGYLQAQWGQLEVQIGLPIPLLLLALVSMAMIGLICGLTSGVWLRGRNGLLRFLVAMLAFLIGLVSAEIVQGALLRLSLRDALTHVADWLEAAEIGAGVLGVLLGIRVGRVRLVVSPQPQGAPSQQQHASAPVEVHVNHSDRRQIVVEPKAASKPKPRPKLKRRRGKQKPIRLGKETTSICPYCLEEVKPHDPRGRVVCEICGTAHHADCWAITGRCQVPHLQT